MIKGIAIALIGAALTAGIADRLKLVQHITQSATELQDRAGAAWTAPANLRRLQGHALPPPPAACAEHGLLRANTLKVGREAAACIQAQIEQLGGAT